MNRIVSLAAVLIVVTLALSAPKKPVALPDMSGPTTCVSLYELQPDGSQVLVGVSESPSYKGDQRGLLAQMDPHLRHAFQFIGRTHGKSEKWLADRSGAPINLLDGPVYTPDYTRTIDGNGSANCWCATPTRDPVTKAITGCEFPCGACEYCVVKP
jgi:hypothetical protein